MMWFAAAFVGVVALWEWAVVLFWSDDKVTDLILAILFSILAIAIWRFA